MADVKERYVSALRNSKEKVRLAKANPPRTEEEKRVFDAFRRNAREDYRTLKTGSQKR